MALPECSPVSITRGGEKRVSKEKFILGNSREKDKANPKEALASYTLSLDAHPQTK